MDDDADALRSRIAELEVENEQLRVPSTRWRRFTVRGSCSLIILLIATILGPVAVVGTWARLELVDTNRFVATFGPLAQSPAIQSFVATEATTAIDQNANINGAVDNLFEGLTGLNLPPRAQTVLPMLKKPLENGIQSVISRTVNEFVASDAFQSIWDTALRDTHSRAIAVLRGRPGGAVKLTDDGTVTLQLGVVINKVIDQVKSALGDSGVSIASSIPTVDKSIPLADGSGFQTVRTIYKVAVAVGFILPWIMLALLILGVCLARNRLRAIVFTAIGLAVWFAIVVIALRVSRVLFVDAVSPSVMPSDAARVLFDQLTTYLLSALVAMILLSLIVIAGGWMGGRSNSAVAFRRASNEIFGSARDFGDRNGMDTGAFGRGVDRWYDAIVLVLVAGTVAWVFFNRPVSVGGVTGAVVFLLCAVIVTQLVRRPVAAPIEP